MYPYQVIVIIGERKQLLHIPMGHTVVHVTQDIMVISVKTSIRVSGREVHLVIHLLPHPLPHLLIHPLPHLVIHPLPHLLTVIHMGDKLLMVCVSVTLDIWVMGAMK